MSIRKKLNTLLKCATVLVILVPLFIGLIKDVKALDTKIIVKSKIEQGNLGYGQSGEWMAARNWGSFTVPQNGQALNFSCSLNEFTIYTLDLNGNEKDVFRRSINKIWDQQTHSFRDVGTIDWPVSLNKLTLGPDTYYFAIPGKPGDSGSLELTIRTP